MKKMLSLAFTALLFSACGVDNIGPTIDSGKQALSSYVADAKTKINANVEQVQEQIENLKEVYESLTDTKDQIEQLLQIGNSYRDILNYGEAEAYYLKALGLDASSYVAQSNLAVLYEEAGRYDLAKQYLQEIYNTNKDNLAYRSHAIDRIIVLDLKEGKTAEATVALNSFAADYGDKAETIAMIKDLRTQISDKEESMKNTPVLNQ